MNIIQKEIVQARNQWKKVKDEDQSTLMLGLMSEVCELAEAIRKIYVYKKEDKPENDKSSLKHEFADVFIFLSALADKCNVDLEEAARSKIKLNNEKFSIQHTR